MRSGTTTRETSASITFPERAASESTPVSTGSDGGGGIIVAAGMGVGILVLVAIGFLLLARGRRKKDDERS
jgi:predicted metalloprotease